MEDKKAQFLEIFNTHITRDGKDDLLDWLNHSDFFTAPASTRFHGNHEGGLLEHSINVYNSLVSLLENTGLKENYSNETIAIVALLHDVCKVNYYKKGTRNVKENGVWVQKEVYEVDEKFPCGHGEKSVIILQNFIHLDSEEIFAIRAHMGGFDTSVKGGEFAMPLADHLGGVDSLEIMIGQGRIEIVHLGFIRGRDIKNSIIMCSEAENMTKEHIQLLLGRVGEGSSLWINGDYKQVDGSVFRENNGLMIAVDKLKGHPRFGFVKLLKTERSETAAMADLLD